MKIVKKTAAVLLIAVLLLTAVSCSGGSVVGMWESEDDEIGRWEFGSDNTFVISVDDEIVSGTYVIDGDTLTLDMLGEKQTVTFSVNGDKLEMVSEGVKIKFNRVK